MIISVLMSFFIGLAFGYMFCLRWADDISLIDENKKLRKENEVLWARLKDEGKIDRF